MAARYTVRDLVTDALKDAGVIGVGATPNANEAADAVRTLNRILDGLALESLTAPGTRLLQVSYPAGFEFVEFTRGESIEPWQVTVPEILLTPSVVSIKDGSSFRSLPYMDTEEFFARDDVSSCCVQGWHWENTQAPRLFLADPPSEAKELRVAVPCDPYRDVDMNTDMTNWRVGLRPFLCAALAAAVARQNGMDSSAMSSIALNAKAVYARSVRSPSVVRMDQSAPGMSPRGDIDIRTGSWL